MMMADSDPVYDVAIVGTGPAGGMAAIRLAEAGAKIILLEREALPRDKACGGALSKGAIGNLLDWNFESVVAARTHNISYLLNYQRRVDQQRDNPMAFVNRSEFDMHLVERALTIAPDTVTLRDSCQVLRIEQLSDRALLISSGGDRVQTRFVIGADGVKGPCAKSAGLARSSRLAPAIDVEIEVEDEIWEQEKDRVTFNFACVSGGYGWTFPKDGRLSCGVGSWDRSASINDAMADYLAQNFPSGSVKNQTRRGHPIPLFYGSRQLASGRILLAGDAANLVDPYLGEGIRYALQSGQLAAKYCLAALQNGPEALDGFGLAIDAEISERLKSIAMFISPVFVKSPDYFYRQFIENAQSTNASSYDLLS